jgi:hypothetical protein
LRDLKPPPLPLGYTRDWCSEGDSNTHHRRSERRVSADWTTGAVLAGGFDPPASILPSQSYQDSLIKTVLSRQSYRDGALPNERSEQNGAPCMESNLRPAAYKAAALPTELTEHGAGSISRLGLPLTRASLPTELNQQKLKNGRAFCRASYNGAAVYARPILDVSLCQTARPKGRMHAKSPQWPMPCGTTRSCRLGVLGHVPLSRLVRRRDWPCAGYSGLINPGSGVFVCWNRISAHE